MSSVDDLNEKNFRMGVLGFVMVILIIAAAAVHYNYTEQKREEACAVQKLGYDEDSSGCAELR